MVWYFSIKSDWKLDYAFRNKVFEATTTQTIVNILPQYEYQNYIEYVLLNRIWRELGGLSAPYPTETYRQ